MLEAEYATMFAAEETYWWYRGLHDQVRRAVALCREEADGPLRVLDAGCGTGKVLETLAGEAVTGLDLSATALSLARRRGDFPLTRASAVDLPFRDASFDVVLSLDVLANVPPSAVIPALAEARRTLVPGGRLILNIVAHQFLYSEHDRAVGVQQRYSAGQVRDFLVAAGFRVEKMTYSNTLLFPVAALVRLWRKRARPGHTPRSDLAPLPPRLNAALARMRFVENALMVDYGIPMPFGLSVFAMAKNPVGPARTRPGRSRTRA
ncbi:Methyltransferase type 11 [Solidesulfovibrio fructosivorans JJ]]|uniref:Methyltransferase type 11 n=1 Tax=Solidesulfovibrio fructosivorans JJ] TaxID=596151 RepID=E1K292_SOLFR|nr:class I SAM-dependent methyltransferase [Solidesulfovibrio fructosivorans]EFL49278.1 Methyltransferase type 11 [Solidesulfovibrio fructosivorans JJ]]